MKKHVLLIGPCTNLERQLIGGATISFGYLIDYFEKNNLPYTLINTQHYFGKKRILNPIHVLLKTLLNLPKLDVIFLNSSRGGTKYLAPILFLISKIFRKKFVFRPFGGDIKDYTLPYNKFFRWMLEKMTLQADLVFLQTQELMNFYATKAKNITQLPTSRYDVDTALQEQNQDFQKRFIFLGAVNQEKGIDKIIEATKQLDETYTVHIYGPIQEAKYDYLANTDSIYKGVLEREKVIETLAQYDVLLLPTFYGGEGYPGVIIEAYSLGIPVITTQWKAIPEIVKDKQTGFLIPPKSSESLLMAMQAFNTNNYPNMSRQARKYFLENFEANRVTAKLVQQICSLF